MVEDGFADLQLAVLYYTVHAGTSDTRWHP